MIAVSGGGTGGHFFPALAFIDYARNKEKIKFIGAKRGIEYKLKDLIKVDSLFLNVYPFRGLGMKDKLKAVLSFISSQREINRFLTEDFKALVFGGYTSLPLGLNAIIKGKKLYVHEQNSIPSRTNRLLSKKAEKVFITFEYTRRYFKSAIRTGLPLRKEVKGKVSKEEAKEKLKLNPEKYTLLIFGGSQGALFLNELTVKICDKLPPEIQILLISGESHYEKFKHYERENLKIIPFSLKMNIVFSASDFAISRAGASAITELSYYAIPSIFIPFPYAVDDHQFYNAKEIEELGGGIVIRQEKATPEKILRGLENLLNNRDTFSSKFRSFFIEGAEENIYNQLLE
ncbi:MAG TPA: undecaprenyldiphospho-muramoylpentapeptide beta-N-acetylglucosaminyltransferase [Aquificaceae bacterium]|nr:undecaprenyldiphospho-muramoylpentapeptide beta-N-acetylglucosaminyltransferase [Aquificaceae bacterium]